MSSLQNVIKEGSAAGMVRLFSVRHEFPTEWTKFVNQEPAANQRYELILVFRKEHYPFWIQDHLKSIHGLGLLVQNSADGTNISVYDRPDRGDDQTMQDDLKKDPSFGGLFVGTLSKIAKPDFPTGELKLYFDTKNIDDLWITVSL